MNKPSEHIKLSPEAAGTLATLASSQHISTLTGRRFRFGPTNDKAYQELVSNGLVECTPIIGTSARYELLRDVAVPEPATRHGALTFTPLTDDQRELIAKEAQNDRAVSRAIADGTYDAKNFGARCLGDYARL